MVGGSEQNGVAVEGVALRIARGDIPQRCPRADIVPADIDRQHDRERRLLHDGVVDGNRRRCFEGGLVQPQEAQILSLINI